MVADELAGRYGGTRAWLRARGGRTHEPSYASAKEGAIVLSWTGPLDDAVGVLDQPGMRRALVAYWYDMLLPMRDQGRRSLHARRHDHNVVSQLFAHIRDQRRMALGE